MGVFAQVASAMGLNLKAPITTGMAAVLSGDSLGQSAPNDDVIFGGAIPSNFVKGMSAGEVYETQPHLRTVVSFVARNAAQLGRHVYTKDDTGSRTRVKAGPLVDLLDRPNDYQTGFELFNQLFTELALYDFHMWVPVYRDGRWQIDPIPTAWITGKQMKNKYEVARYRVQPAGSANWYFINAEDAVVFRGYSAGGGQFGSSTVVSLKHVLSEQISAYEFRTQMWERGGRVGNFLTRPKDAPVWGKEARDRFVTMWRSSWSGSGGNAGATPLLEDGMELKSVRFNAKEEQWLEAATLSLSTVAAAYHVPPAMVGVQGYNSFASVKEFRKMLYTETLGPLIAQVEEVINGPLARLLASPRGQYLELNIGEKLQGDFEEQANVLFQAVGGPYMTVNEARQKNNLPKIDGGDELLAPLNMGAAGNNGPAADEPIDPSASDAPVDEAPDAGAPKSSASQRGEPRHPDGAKARTVPGQDVFEGDLKDFFDSQRRTVLKRLGEKAGAAWWDQKRWDQELSTVLLPHLLKMSAGTARQVAGAKRLDPDDYSVARTEAFLKAVADSRAAQVNRTTYDHLKNAADDPDLDPETVFEDSASRAKTVGGTVATFVKAWATVEVAKQLVPERKATKTWLASGLPNSRHADMDGETVGIDEKFSNGADWPGDPVLGAEGVANCGCGVDIDY